MTAAEDRCLRAAIRYQRKPTRANLEWLLQESEPLLREWWRTCIHGASWVEEETIQAGRLKLWEQAPRWLADGEASFLRFIKVHVVGAMRNARNGARQKHFSIEQSGLCLATEQDAGSNAHLSILAVDEILAGLPDTLRIICRMYHIEGYTIREIAIIGGFADSAVEQLLAQASQRLIENGLGKPKQ